MVEYLRYLLDTTTLNLKNGLVKLLESHLKPRVKKNKIYGMDT